MYDGFKLEKTFSIVKKISACVLYSSGAADSLTLSMKIFGTSMPSSLEAQYRASRWRSHPSPMVAPTRYLAWYVMASCSSPRFLLSSTPGSSMILTQAEEASDSGWMVSVRPKANSLQSEGHRSGIYDISYVSDWSRWSSQPIRSLRYIVPCNSRPP